MLRGRSSVSSSIHVNKGERGGGGIVDMAMVKSRQNDTLKGVQIVCSDGTKGVQNDDYCDCSDGSDEPQTSACSHILVHVMSFACADGISFIFPSRVKDGVIDCPDGSDEVEI